MGSKKIYIVTRDDDTTCLDPIGLFDRKGLIKFLREQKKKGHWSYHYGQDNKGHEKLINRIKIYPRLKIVGHSLNKIDPGTIYYEWQDIK